MNVFRKIQITEKFSSDGIRLFRGISQAFESDSGRILSDEDAGNLVSRHLRANRKTRRERRSQFVLPCLETVRDLVYAILAFPEPSSSDRNKLLTLVFGSADFDALSIEKSESSHQEERNTLDYQLRRSSSVGLLPDVP